MSCKHQQPQRLRQAFEECLRLHLSCFKPIIKENDLEIIPDYLSSHVSSKCILQTLKNHYCKNIVKVFSALKMVYQTFSCCSLCIFVLLNLVEVCFYVLKSLANLGILLSHMLMTEYNNVLCYTLCCCASCSIFRYLCL